MCWYEFASTNQFIYRCKEIQSKLNIKRLNKDDSDTWRKKKKPGTPIVPNTHIEFKRLFKQWHRLQEKISDRYNFTKRDLYWRLLEQLKEDGWTMEDRSWLQETLVTNVYVNKKLPVNMRHFEFEGSF